MSYRRVRRYNEFKKRMRGILPGNFVLSMGLAVPFAVTACVSLKSAVMLSLVMLVTALPVMAVAAAFGKFLPLWTRSAVYVFLSLMIIQTVMYFTSPIYPQLITSLGIFLPLMSVNSAVIRVAQDKNMTKSLKIAALSALRQSLGFAVVAIPVGALRELIGDGTLWDKVIKFPLRIPGMAYPFMGFLLLGFISAGLHAADRFITGSLVRKPQNQRASILSEPIE